MDPAPHAPQHAQSLPTAPSPAPTPTPVLDAGWLFLAAGLAVLGATVLIPAADDLAGAEHLLERAHAIEQHRQDRLDRYESYLGALDRQDPSLVLALAQSQLNQIPADRQPVLATTVNAHSSASVFPALEPPALKLPQRRSVDSLLQHWTTGDDTRLWLIAGGAACVLIGLLPKAKK